MTREQFRIRLKSAAWMFGLTIFCCAMCYIGLFKGMDILYSRGRVPIWWLLGGFLFGLAALVCLIWTLKILVKGTVLEREVPPSTELEAPWWKPTS